MGVDDMATNELAAGAGESVSPSSPSSSSIAMRKKPHTFSVAVVGACLCLALVAWSRRQLQHGPNHRTSEESLAVGSDLRRQRGRGLRTMVRTWSALSAKAQSCQDLLHDGPSAGRSAYRGPVAGREPFSRRALLQQESKGRSPARWDDQDTFHSFVESPTLRRVDRILQDARIYNKDLVVDVTDDNALADVSLYASAYGWHVLTLQTDTQGQVRRMCEATKSASSHHVLPLWAGNFNSVPNLDVDGGESASEEPPTVRLDQLAALTTESSSSRIRLLHVNLPRGEWRALLGASKLLSQRRVDHVLVTLHFDRQHDEDEAVRVLETLLQAGYLPVDDKDRPRPPGAARFDEDNETYQSSTSYVPASTHTSLDATEYLRHLIEAHQGAPHEVWFYLNKI